MTSLQFATRTIERVLIVDDDKGVRESFSYPVEELGLRPIEQSEPLPELLRFVEDARDKSDAAICDHRLRLGSYYAGFNGAELVASLYRIGFPALLCTRWDQAGVDDIRPYRRNIPVLLNPGDLDPETLKAGFEVCSNELAGDFQPHRRPWRTQIRVEEIDEEAGFAGVIIPAWNPTEGVRLRLSEIPAVSGGAFLYAQVNLGAERQEELYFDWEVG